MNERDELILFLESLDSIINDYNEAPHLADLILAGGYRKVVEGGAA